MTDNTEGNRVPAVKRGNAIMSILFRQVRVTANRIRAIANRIHVTANHIPVLPVVLVTVNLLLIIATVNFTLLLQILILLQLILLSARLTDTNSFKESHRHPLIPNYCTHIVCLHHNYSHLNQLFIV